MTTTTKVVLRKKAPFFCRTTVQGKPTCLAPLAETDGELCPACVTKEVALAKHVALPIPRVEDAEAGSRYVTESEHAAQLAKGPLWPTI